MAFKMLLEHAKYISYVDDITRDILKAEKKRRTKAAKNIRDKIREKIKKDIISTPGQPPGKHSGGLIKNIKMANKKYASFVGAVAPAYHALLLEFGTKSREPEMKKRPFMLKTFNEEVGATKKEMYGNWLI